MTTQTTERAFEDTVESLLLDSGWQPGDRARWDVEARSVPVPGNRLHQADAA